MSQAVYYPFYLSNFWLSVLKLRHPQTISFQLPLPAQHPIFDRTSPQIALLSRQRQELSCRLQEYFKSFDAIVLDQLQLQVNVVQSSSSRYLSQIPGAILHTQRQWLDSRLTVTLFSRDSKALELKERFPRLKVQVLPKMLMISVEVWTQPSQASQYEIKFVTAQEISRELFGTRKQVCLRCTQLVFNKIKDDLPSDIQYKLFLVKFSKLLHLFAQVPEHLQAYLQFIYPDCQLIFQKNMTFKISRGQKLPCVLVAPEIWLDQIIETANKVDCRIIDSLSVQSLQKLYDYRLSNAKVIFLQSKAYLLQRQKSLLNLHFRDWMPVRQLNRDQPGLTIVVHEERLEWAQKQFNRQNKFASLQSLQSKTNLVYKETSLSSQACQRQRVRKISSPNEIRSNSRLVIDGEYLDEVSTCNKALVDLQVVKSRTAIVLYSQRYYESFQKKIQKFCKTSGHVYRKTRNDLQLQELARRCQLVVYHEQKDLPHLLKLNYKLQQIPYPRPKLILTTSGLEIKSVRSVQIHQLSSLIEPFKETLIICTPQNVEQAVHIVQQTQSLYTHVITHDQIGSGLSDCYLKYPAQSTRPTRAPQLFFLVGSLCVQESLLSRSKQYYYASQPAQLIEQQGVKDDVNSLFICQHKHINSLRQLIGPFKNKQVLIYYQSLSRPELLVDNSKIALLNGKLASYADAFVFDRQHLHSQKLTFTGSVLDQKYIYLKNLYLEPRMSTVTSNEQVLKTQRTITSIKCEMASSVPGNKASRRQMKQLKTGKEKSKLKPIKFKSDDQIPLFDEIKQKQENQSAQVSKTLLTSKKKGRLFQLVHQISIGNQTSRPLQTPSQTPLTFRSLQDYEPKPQTDQIILKRALSQQFKRRMPTPQFSYWRVIYFRQESCISLYSLAQQCRIILRKIYSLKDLRASLQVQLNTCIVTSPQGYSSILTLSHLPQIFVLNEQDPMPKKCQKATFLRDSAELASKLKQGLTQKPSKFFIKQPKVRFKSVRVHGSFDHLQFRPLYAELDLSGINYSEESQGRQLNIVGCQWRPGVHEQGGWIWLHPDPLQVQECWSKCKSVLMVSNDIHLIVRKVSDWLINQENQIRIPTQINSNIKTLSPVLWFTNNQFKFDKYIFVQMPAPLTMVTSRTLSLRELVSEKPRVGKGSLVFIREEKLQELNSLERLGKQIKIAIIGQQDQQLKNDSKVIGVGSSPQAFMDELEQSLASVCYSQIILYNLSKSHFQLAHQLFSRNKVTKATSPETLTLALHPLALVITYSSSLKQVCQAAQGLDLNRKNIVLLGPTIQDNLFMHVQQLSQIKQMIRVNQLPKNSTKLQVKLKRSENKLMKRRTVQSREKNWGRQMSEILGRYQLQGLRRGLIQ